MNVKTVLVVVAEIALLIAGFAAVSYMVGSMHEPRRVPRSMKELRDSCQYIKVVVNSNGVPVKTVWFKPKPIVR